MHAEVKLQLLPGVASHLRTESARDVAHYQNRCLQTRLKFCFMGPSDQDMNANMCTIQNYTELTSYMSERSQAKSTMLILLFGKSK